jgi:hypothetical protein
MTKINLKKLKERLILVLASVGLEKNKVLKFKQPLN